MDNRSRLLSLLKGRGPMPKLPLPLESRSKDRQASKDGIALLLPRFRFRKSAKALRRRRDSTNSRSTKRALKTDPETHINPTQNYRSREAGILEGAPSGCQPQKP